MSTEKSEVGHVTAPMNIHHYENLWSYVSRGCQWSWHPILRAFCAQWTISGWSKCDGGWAEAVGGMCLAASDLRGLPPNWASAIRGAVYNIELMCDTLRVCWTQTICRTFLCFAALCQSWTSCVAILLLGSVTLLVYPHAVSMWILFHLGFTESMYNWAIPVVRWEVIKMQLSVFSSRSVMTVYRK